MSFWEALLLGIVQGLTEFFPVSSSGHLILIEHLLGFKELKNYIFFDLICHLGTLLAVLIFFSSEIRSILSSKSKFAQIVIATLPLFPLVFLLKEVKGLFDQPALLGYFFLLTALILYIGQKFAEPRHAAPYRNALLIGLSQAAAIVPGVSRSGTTISAAKLLGFTPESAVTFSFILSIPTVLGGMTLEGYKLFKDRHAPLEMIPEISWYSYAIAFISAFLIGLFALRLLLRIAGTAKFQFFSWYCVILGLATLYYFH